jgi:pimeloyl-ACP methyl ester carboxylesterase
VLATVNGSPVHYAEEGSGTPVLAVHGAGVDHREIRAGLETVFADRSGYRRIYPDLPGMGGTPLPATVGSNDDVVDVLFGFVDAVIGDEAFLLVGQSYGGYLARAIARGRPGQVAGLALVCSADAQTAVEEVPEHVVLHTAGEENPETVLGPAQAAEYRDYLVVQTAATLRRYQEAVAPAAGLVDRAGLGRVFQRWRLGTPPEQGPVYPNPTLILAGRQDASVGYVASWRLLEHYPRATFAVLDRAGHALLHEQTGLVTALLGEWLDRVREHHRQGRHADAPPA